MKTTAKKKSSASSRPDWRRDPNIVVMRVEPDRSPERLKEIEAIAAAPTRKEQVRLSRAAAIRRAKKYPPEMQARLKALAKIRDEDIDTSDIPEITDEEWRTAKKYIGLHYRPMKKAVTIRLDADLLAWFKAKGPGYQTAINRVLREYFASQR